MSTDHSEHALLTRIAELDRQARDLGVEHGEACIQFLADTTRHLAPTMQAVIVDVIDWYDDPDEGSIECAAILDTTDLPDCATWNALGIRASLPISPLWTEEDVDEPSTNRADRNSLATAAETVTEWATTAVRHADPHDLLSWTSLDGPPERRLWHITLAPGRDASNPAAPSNAGTCQDD